jgi:hypothetical protein
MHVSSHNSAGSWEFRADGRRSVANLCLGPATDPNAEIWVMSGMAVILPELCLLNYRANSDEVLFDSSVSTRYEDGGVLEQTSG